MKNPGFLARFHYATRGYALALMWAALAFSRYDSDAPVQPQWLGLALAGAALRLWSGAHIAGHSNGLAWATGPRVVAGPYRLRHPLYLSNVLAAAGLIGFSHSLSAAGSCTLWLVAVGHHALLIAWEEIAWEEAALRGVPSQPGVPGQGWRAAWQRQFRNLVYALTAFLLIALLAWKPWEKGP